MMYKTLQDAGEEYAVGHTEVWYYNTAVGRGIGLGIEFYTKVTGKTIDPNNLSETHVKLGTLSYNDPEDVFTMMQGEVWSPMGEASNMIKSLGLTHTSMSVGDIIVVDDKVLIVEMMGFKELPR